MLQTKHFDQSTPASAPPQTRPLMEIPVEPCSEEVRRFIEIYDVIRTDKAGPLSRHELDWSFLAGRFGTLFEMTRVYDVLEVATSAPNATGSIALKGRSHTLKGYLPDNLIDEFGALFDEMANCPSLGVLARFGTATGAAQREYELVLLPTARDGVITAIGVIASLSGPAISEPFFAGALEPAEHLRLQGKNCFDLRQRMLSGLGLFLRQCIANMAQMLPGFERND